MFSIPEVKKVEEVMDTKFTTIDEDTRIEDAIKEMIKSNTKTLMVIDSSDQLKGIIS
ncbi:CBS domain protein, partial [Clostridioides difficile P2]